MSERKITVNTQNLQEKAEQIRQKSDHWPITFLESAQLAAQLFNERKLNQITHPVHWTTAQKCLEHLMNTGVITPDSMPYTRERTRLAFSPEDVALVEAGMSVLPEDSGLIVFRRQTRNYPMLKHLASEGYISIAGPISKHA